MDQSWAIKDIFMMLEGGNSNFNAYVSQNQKEAKNRSKASSVDTDRRCLIENTSRFCTKIAQAYGKMLLKRSEEVLGKLGILQTS